MSDDRDDESPTRRDPRRRPPDPAGTQPKFDPEELLPTSQRGLWADRPYAAPEPEPAPGHLWSGPQPAPGAAPAGGPPGRGATAAHAPATGGAGEATAPGPSRHSNRFQFLTGALLAIAAAGIFAFVVILLADDGPASTRAGAAGPPWSSWQPVAGGDGPAQIAEHVGRKYRLPGGEQLVAVEGGPLQVLGLPVTVALRETTGDITLLGGAGVLFRMCGLGPGCSIATGRPSTARHLLLRREALELALYSFRYLGVQEAVVFLPPSKDDVTTSAATRRPIVTQAVLFRRQEAGLTGAVARPLAATIVDHTPTVDTVRRSPDAQLVDDLTAHNVFKAQFEQASQDPRAFLVLSPLP